MGIWLKIKMKFKWNKKSNKTSIKAKNSIVEQNVDNSNTVVIGDVVNNAENGIAIGNAQNIEIKKNEK